MAVSREAIVCKCTGLTEMYFAKTMQFLLHFCHPFTHNVLASCIFVVYSSLLEIKKEHI